MSDVETTLTMDVYLALAAVGWADGNLDADEADAIVKAALEDGLELDEVSTIEAATKTPTGLDELDLSGLGPADRRYVYGVASWMTRLDQEIAPGEVEALDAIAQGLGLSASERADVDIAVQQVSYLSEDERPFGYDLAALRRLLRDGDAS